MADLPHRTQPNTIHTLPGHELQAHDLEGKYGLDNAIKIIEFLNSPEGQEVKAEIAAKVAIEHIIEDNLRQEELESFHHKLLDSLKHRAEPHSRQDHSAERRILELLERDDEKKEVNKHVHEYDFLVENLANEQSSLDALQVEAQVLDEELLTLDSIMKEIEEASRLFKTPKLKPDESKAIDEEDEQEEIEFQTQLRAYKQQLQKELAGLEQYLSQHDVAASDQPSAVPAGAAKSPSPQKQSGRLKQMQNMRATFCRHMIHEINEHAEEGMAPTEGQTAQHRERMNPAMVLADVKSQIEHHYASLQNEHIRPAVQALTHRKGEVKQQIGVKQVAVKELSQKIHQHEITKKFDGVVKAKRDEHKQTHHAKNEHQHTETPRPGRR